MVQSQLPTLSFATAWKPKRRHTKEQHLKWRGFRFWWYLFRPRSLLLLLPCYARFCYAYSPMFMNHQTKFYWKHHLPRDSSAMNAGYVVSDMLHEWGRDGGRKIIFWGRQPSIFLICMACTICVKPLNTCPVSTTYIFAEAVRSINDALRWC